MEKFPSIALTTIDDNHTDDDDDNDNDNDNNNNNNNNNTKTVITLGEMLGLKWNVKLVDNEPY